MKKTKIIPADEPQLTPAQQQAVQTTQGPLLILAGAGSGKTRVLTSKIKYLIESGCASAENIIAITFTNKAAGEMKKRVGATASWIMTFHGFAARILRLEGFHINLPRNFVIYDEGDSEAAMKQAIKSMGQPCSFTISSLRSAISSAKNEGFESATYAQFAKGFFEKTVAQVFLQYENILKANNAVDFDDLLLLANKLFHDCPAVKEHYQNQFRYVLVDEYQDTNSAQYLLSRTLAGKWGNICVVGDPAQNIYSWRGADFRNLINFQKDFPKVKIFNLEENFRSSQKILDCANLIIKDNSSHPVLNLFTKKNGGEKIEIAECDTEKEEAQTILRWHNTRPLEQLAVLYRTNAQSRPIEELLIKKSIPYVLWGGVKFYERREIKDLIAYLRLLQNPADSVSRARIEKIGKTRTQNFDRAIQSYLDNPDKIPTLDLLNQILEATSYLNLFKPEKEEDLDRISNINELKSVAREFPVLSDFLENTALLESGRSKNQLLLATREDDSNPIILMTLHAAKGLEFDMVVITGMEEGIFPHERSLWSKDELEEERRLCYVGITRAKKKLCFTWCRNRMFQGTKSFGEKSRFLAKIQREMI